MMSLTITTTTDRTKTTCATPDTPTRDDHSYGIGDGNDNQRQGPCVEFMDHHETTPENSDKDVIFFRAKPKEDEKTKENEKCQK